MYYSNKFIDKLEKELKDSPSFKNESAYLTMVGTAIGKEVIKNPRFYKRFGIYWWEMKDLIRKEYTDLGNYVDIPMQKNAFHKTIFRTIMAGMYYQDKKSNETDFHEYINESTGESSNYTLYDDDFTF